MATKKTDTFANIACVNVVESAANTQTSVKYSFPFSIMDKMAIIVNRIEYWWEGFGALNSTDDRSIAALVAAATIVNLDTQSDPLIIDSSRMARLDFGAAASGNFFFQPFIKDFSSLPGGGIIMAPSPLYGMVKGTGCGAVTGCQIKLFYTYMELNTDEYWQLVESRRIISG